MNITFARVSARKERLTQSDLIWMTCARLYSIEIGIQKHTLVNVEACRNSTKSPIHSHIIFGNNTRVL